jgi:hypothetical protein
MTTFSMSRKGFLDRWLGPQDLDDLTDLWLAWQEEAWLRRVRRLRRYHAVEVRLYGFPRPRGGLLQGELQRRLAERGWRYTADLSDPDLLVVSSGFLPFSRPCSLRAWLALLRGHEFAGLVVTLRLSVQEWPGPAEGPAHAGDTLVLCGRLQEGDFLLKALWPAGLGRDLDRLYERAAHVSDEDIVWAFDKYRRGGPVPPPPAGLFNLRRTQTLSRFLVGMVMYLPGGPGRLRWFMTRTALYLGGLLLGIGLYVALPRVPAAAGIAAVNVLCATALAYVVAKETARVRTYHRTMTASLKRTHSRRLVFEPVDLNELGVRDDPNAVKYTAELQMLGCRHLADVRTVPGPPATAYVRVFVLPAQHTYVFLNLMLATTGFKKFPAHAFFLLSTYFENLRVVSIHEGGGFRKRFMPGVLSRVFPGVHDPATLLAAHGRLVEQKQAEGHVLGPLMEAPALFERMAQDHEEASAVLRRRGYYSWSAAVRQNFGLIRRDLLGKIPAADQAGG